MCSSNWQIVLIVAIQWLSIASVDVAATVATNNKSPQCHQKRTKAHFMHITGRCMSVAVHCAALAASQVAQVRRRQEQRRLVRQVQGTGAHWRRWRNQVKNIYLVQLGPTLFRQAYYWMKYHSFKKLAQKLHHSIVQHSHKRRNTNSHERYVSNGPITPSVCLACALCYFAGGSPNDIMTTFCIGHADTLRSIWYVVDAINAHPDLQISYPHDHDEQRSIAESFKKIRSKLRLLLWSCWWNSCVDTTLQRMIVRGQDAALASSFVVVNTILVSTAKLFAMPEVNSLRFQLSIQDLPLIFSI